MADCDNCGAPMRIDRDRGVLVCDHCHTEREPFDSPHTLRSGGFAQGRPPAALEYLEILNETSLLCPICSTPLANGRLEGHSVICCARCFGMLIDMNRFMTVIEAVRAREARTARSLPPRGQHPGDRVLDCPQCGQPMIGHLYGGPGNIVIDTCERCLVNWLDAGELRRVATAPDAR